MAGEDSEAETESDSDDPAVPNSFPAKNKNTTVDQSSPTTMGTTMGVTGATEASKTSSRETESNESNRNPFESRADGKRRSEAAQTQKTAQELAMEKMEKTRLDNKLRSCLSLSLCVCVCVCVSVCVC